MKFILSPVKFSMTKVSILLNYMEIMCFFHQGAGRELSVAALSQMTATTPPLRRGHVCDRAGALRAHGTQGRGLSAIPGMTLHHHDWLQLPVSCPLTV